MIEKYKKLIRKNRITLSIIGINVLSSNIAMFCDKGGIDAGFKMHALISLLIALALSAAIIFAKQNRINLKNDVLIISSLISVVWSNPISAAFCLVPLIRTGGKEVIDTRSKAEQYVSMGAFLACSSICVIKGGYTLSLYSTVLVSAAITCDMWLLLKDVNSRLKNTAKKVTTVQLKADTDALTGLYNRQSLDSFMQKTAKASSVFSVIMSDIDNFKKINDTYGHAEGDIILTRLADIFISESRKDDRPFRYGGEEFCIVCPNTTEEEARELAERIREKFFNIPYKAPNGETRHFSVSIGVSALGGENYVGVKETIDRSDKALYVSKKSGKNRTTLYSEVENSIGVIE